MSQLEFRFLYGPRGLGFGARASVSPQIQSVSCSVVSIPAAIAGIIRNPAEIVMQEVQGQHMTMVLDALGEGVSQPGESSAWSGCAVPRSSL